MFEGTEEFDGDLSPWDVSSVTNMEDMFSRTKAFHGSTISSWDVSNVKSMKEMFSEAWSFNGFISNWNVAAATNMYGMFSDAQSFDQNLSDWDISSVTNLNWMFSGAMVFNAMNNNALCWNLFEKETSFMFDNSFGCVESFCCKDCDEELLCQSILS